MNEYDATIDKLDIVKSRMKLNDLPADVYMYDIMEAIAMFLPSEIREKLWSII